MATSAPNYFKVADGHRLAARILFPHVSQAGTSPSSVFFAFYNVLGFSIEIYLKAFLVSAGMKSEDLSKKPFGHNLKNLFVEASKRDIWKTLGLQEKVIGLEVQSSALEKVIDTIGEHHGEYTYRYIKDDKGDYQILTSMETVFTVVDDLHERVRQSLGISG